MNDVIKQLLGTINAQKGEILGLDAMLLGILKSLPAEQRDVALTEFNSEIRDLRTAISSSNSDPEVSQGLENYARALNQRIERGVN